MKITPDYMEVGRLFGHDRTFRVPKYQRNYAWQADQIGDFKSDLKRCLDAREEGSGQSRPHFFGGLVTVRHTVPGRQELEVVDGQQRLATFVLLVAQLRNAMTRVAALFSKDDIAYESATFLLKKVEMLKGRFQLLQTSVSMKVVDIPRLQLSGPDNDFFSRLIAGESPEIKRKSHEYLKAAYDALGTFLDELTANLSPVDQAKRLDTLATVLEDDWTILNMETTTQAEAYTLFQVLNDRGRGLTEGELLRAKTLELLDGHGSALQSTTVEEAWDEILVHEADELERNFRWIYASHAGDRPSQTQLFDDLLRQFFPSNIKPVQTPQDAAAVVDAVKQLRKECALMMNLRRGEWPYSAVEPPVTAWDKDRLRLLTVELDHTNCLPLLLAATQLPQKLFAEVVHLLERFVFRYKLVVNAHIGPASSVYNKQALDIRAAPQAYKVQALRDALKTLVEKNADDGKFADLFYALQYGTRPSKKVKYALLTLEHYRAWLEKGANGKPTPDRTHVYDFPNTTVEHVYPAKSANPSADMDAVVDSIGNLAILGPTENNAAGNKDFAGKKALYGLSSFQLTKGLAQLASWDLAAVNARRSQLKDMALKVFAF